ncbi:MAG TPA: hypothetical protein VJR89_15580 [Polyangiales bacterium]|nr:hypothetical protein [Polyangiales bacterium]
MSERIIVTILTAVCGASWCHYFASMLNASRPWRWLWLPVGIALGLFTWWRYRGGLQTEVAFAEEVPMLERVAITSVASLAGVIAGVVAPRTFGARSFDWTITVPLALTFALLLGWLGWHHPTLFYKNRRF